MERGRGVGQVLVFKIRKQGAVELFGKVVAELVGAVHATLDIGQPGVCGGGSAGLVFNMPEVEVGAMLAGYKG
jgi:hypothetical protein